MMAIEGGDQSFRMAQPEGISRYRVVVAGSSYQECKYPAQANEGRIMGVSLQSQHLEQKPIAVRRFGLVHCECAEPVQEGDAVVIADSGGRIKPAKRSSVLLGSTVSNNAVEVEFKSPGLVGNTFSILLSEGEEDFPSTIQLYGNQINIQLQLDPVTYQIIVTANDLVDLINSDPVVSQLVSAKNHPASNGTGRPIVQNLIFRDAAMGVNPIGNAQESASSSGDIIQVFIIPTISF